jgi:starch synthase
VRILYCAIDQTVPGTTGGSVHVSAVAEGLAALDHEVHVLTTPGKGTFPAGQGGNLQWIPMSPPWGAKQLRWMRLGRVREIVARLKPDVIIERYYNFGGEGILAADGGRPKTVLEVNAPVIDFEGSGKARLDRLLVVEPMRKWRERICERADLIVTPNTAILPPSTPASKIVRLEWGADTERFHPDAAGRVPFERPAPTVAVFAGAFRSWHGAVQLVRAVRQLHERGRTDIGAVLIGDGPELPAVREAAHGLPQVRFTGPLLHADMPAALASTDIGVAPFDVSAHGPLALGFYWSPLKIFEYMATGLPVVAPRVDRIPSLVEHAREGLLYQPGAGDALADTLERLADPGVRRSLGQAARERAVREYSWRAHCEALSRAIAAL